MYDEYSLLKNAQERIEKNLPVDQKWMNVFTRSSPARTKNLLKTVQAVLSIPVSNVPPPRTYISFNGRKSRNRKDISLVKSESCVLVNCEMSCSEYINIKPALLKPVLGNEQI
jgi:hypothetical protein